MIWISYVVSAISLVCTLTNLWLIHIMKKWNGFLAVITSMCCCQIVYDVSFALHISANDGSTAIAVWAALQFFGGISVSVWTNILAFVVLRVVVSLKSTDIMKNFYLLTAIAMIPSLLTGFLILGMQLSDRRDRFAAVEGFYYWARIGSIAINFIIHGIVMYKTYQLNRLKTWAQRTPQEIAIQILSHRMIYYPCMQAISRIGASWYEALYGYGPYVGNTSNYQFTLACLYAGLSPATGIGYLVVFLMMQPYAVAQLRSVLLTGRPIDPQVLDTERKQRRESFLNRSTLISGALGSDIVGTSSLTSHGDLSNLHNQVSSLTFTPPSAKEEQQEFQCMDDDELVATIHRAEQRGMFLRSRFFSADVRGESSIVTGATSSTVTSNPVHSVATGVVHTARVGRTGGGKGVDLANDQL